jgi:hypothetical protein
MLSRHRRLRRPERSPFFQPPAEETSAIGVLALRELSNEHLELLLGVSRKEESGLNWDISEEEADALQGYRAA